jgi:hypothetical protein
LLRDPSLGPRGRQVAAGDEESFGALHQLSSSEISFDLRKFVLELCTALGQTGPREQHAELLPYEIGKTLWQIALKMVRGEAQTHFSQCFAAIAKRDRTKGSVRLIDGIKNVDCAGSAQLLDNHTFSVGFAFQQQGNLLGGLGEGELSVDDLANLKQNFGQS